MTRDAPFLLPVYSEYGGRDPLSVRLQLQALTLAAPNAALRGVYQQAFDAATKTETATT